MAGIALGPEFRQDIWWRTLFKAPLCMATVWSFSEMHSQWLQPI